MSTGTVTDPVPPLAYVAPARYPLTVLHRQDPAVGPGRDGEGEPTIGRAMCGLFMGTDELWVPIERRPGDKVCDGCEGRPSDVQEVLL